jgi:membrane-associated phospholipid phosphatase
MVARHRTDDADNRAREELQAVRAPAADAAAVASGPLGKEYLHVPVTAGLGLALRRHGTGARSAVPLLASLLSELLNRAATRAMPIKVVPSGHPEYHKRKPSFPSGHALETTAVSLTCAYVLAREAILPATVAFTGAGVLSGASTVGRLVLDRHWVTDAIAGSLLGVAVAAAAASVYEIIPPSCVTPRRRDAVGTTPISRCGPRAYAV